MTWWGLKAGRRRGCEFGSGIGAAKFTHMELGLRMEVAFGMGEFHGYISLEGVLGFRIRERERLDLPRRQSNYHRNESNESGSSAAFLSTTLSKRVTNSHNLFPKAINLAPDTQKSGLIPHFEVLS